MVTFAEGEFVHPGPWSEQALAAVGRMPRRLHDAAASLKPPPGAAWKPRFLREVGGPERVWSHGDVAPWNVVTRGGMPHCSVDGEFVGPADPLAELARVCWLFPQPHEDGVADRQGLPPAAVRARQVRLLCDAYGLPAEPRRSLLQRIVEVAVREAAQEAIDVRVTPGRVGPTWGLAWRARAAAWMLRQRDVIAGALQ